MRTNIAFGGRDNDELHIVDSLASIIHVAKIPFAGKRMFSHLERLPAEDC